MKEEKVILVNTNDEPIGLMEKIEAHEKGLLHRAFSVFIYNDKNEIMLQKRAAHKYHTPGLWTNTCCSHPRDGESVVEAGQRRLQEEMGFVTEIKPVTSFIYKAPFDNGLTEHEFDHVLVGYYNDEPVINPDEVDDWKWMSADEIRDEISKHPEKFTAWFKIIFEKYYQHLI